MEEACQHVFTCEACKRTYATRKGLNIHVSKTPRCHMVLQTWFLCRVCQDASAPHDELEDDPPADWHMAEDPPDDDVAAYHESSRACLEEAASHEDLHQIDQDVQIEDLPEEDLVHEEFPGLAGQPIGSSQTTFETMRNQQHKGQLGDYGPFMNQADWDLATWLMDSGASQTDIDKFLKLDVVSLESHQ